MESIKVKETIDLVTEYVKVNSLLMKLNKLIRYHLSDKSVLTDEEDEEYITDGHTDESKQYAELRIKIGALHDRLFTSLQGLDYEEKNQVIGFINEKVKKYDIELEELRREVQEYYDVIKSNNPDKHGERLLAISKISVTASRREEVEGYLMSYNSLKHYLGVLVLSTNKKK